MAKSSKLKAVTKESKPVFNPQQSYTWNVDDVFAISGEDFGLVDKLLQALLNNPEAQKYALGLEVAKRWQNMIKENVEEGLMKPAPKEPNQAEK